MSSKDDKSGQNIVQIVAALLGVAGAIGAAIIAISRSPDTNRQEEFQTRQFLNTTVYGLKQLEDQVGNCNPSEVLCREKIRNVCSLATSAGVTVQTLLDTKRISENDESVQYISTTKEQYCELLDSIPPSGIPADPSCTPSVIPC